MNHINKPVGFNPVANSYNTQFSKQQQINASEQSKDQKSSDNVLLNERSAVALKMVHQSISAKFTSVEGFNKNIVEHKSEKLDIFDFEAVAKNVMTFVTSSLSAAKSRGASSSELEQMLNQAREGANNGIDEAIEELGGLNVLDEDLSVGIEKARDLINEGLDKTQQELNDNVASAERSSIPTSVEMANSFYHGQSNSSDLSITTVDGDIVTISFTALKASQAGEYFKFSSGEDGKGISYQTDASSYSSMNFSYSVQGYLDKEELASIDALIKDISKIENDFFTGDIEGAFNKAIELGYDEKQLSSFSLELRQIQTSYASQAYSEVANYTETADFDDKLNSVVKPVLDFIGEFKEIRDNANRILFKEGGQFNNLLESVLNSQFNHNQELVSQFNKFIEKL